MKITAVAIIFVASLAPANAGFSSWMPGANAPKTPPSFAPGGGGKPYAPASGSGMGNYLDSVVAPGSSLTPPPLVDMPDVAVRSSSTTPTTTTTSDSGLSYLEQMGGGSSAPAKPASYAPGGGKKAFAPNGGSGMGSYLENVAPSAGATTLPPPPATPATEIPVAAAEAAVKIFGSYLDQVAGAGSAPVKKASYGPGNGKPYAPTGGSGMGSYLENVAPAISQGPAVTAAAAQPAVTKTNAAPTSASYLEQMGGGSAPVKEASFAPGGKPYVFGGTGLGNYLDNVAAEPASYVAVPAETDPSSDNNAVLEAIFRMNDNMNTNQKKTIEVLKGISAGVRTLVSKASARGGATSGHWQ